REPVAGDAPHAPVEGVQGPEVTAMSADEPAPPDISGDYVERFEWDHANTLFTRYTIGQSGTRVTLKLTREEWLGVPPVHFEGSGVIEQGFGDRPAVRVPVLDRRP